MTIEVVTVKAAGQSFDAWEAVNLRASAGEAARSFRVTAAAIGGLAILAKLFPVGTPVDVLAGDDLVCRGYVDSRRAALSKDRGEVQISGRSKSQDVIDCSAEHATGRLENVTLLEAANTLAEPLGVRFHSAETLGRLPLIQITPGETLFGLLSRYVNDEGLTMAGRADGGIDFWRASKPKKHAGGLVEGQNLLSGDSTFSTRKRHSKHRVRGQRALGMGADDLGVEATAKDDTIRRHRPLITVMQDDIDHGRALKRARRNRDRAAGRGLTATVHVPSWRDEDGTLWSPGWLVWTESPFLGLCQDMLIEHVDYQQSGAESSGTKATLHLVDPRAYGGKKGKGAKSSEAWDMDSSDAE